MKELTDVEFYQKTQDGTVIVDFYAPWCQPCKVLAPVLESVEKETGVAAYKINVDEYPDISEEFEIRGLPTVLKLTDGDIVARSVGAVPKAKLKLNLGL